MDIKKDFEENWLREIEDFISFWEKEIEDIMEKKLDPQECHMISKKFSRERDFLLSRKPVGVSDENLVSRLQPLNSKLNISLAVALSSIPEKEKNEN